MSFADKPSNYDPGNAPLILPHAENHVSGIVASKKDCVQACYTPFEGILWLYVQPVFLSSSRRRAKSSVLRLAGGNSTTIEGWPHKRSYGIWPWLLLPVLATRSERKANDSNPQNHYGEDSSVDYCLLA